MPLMHILVLGVTICTLTTVLFAQSDAYRSGYLYRDYECKNRQGQWHKYLFVSRVFEFPLALAQSGRLEKEATVRLKDLLVIFVQPVLGQACQEGQNTLRQNTLWYTGTHKGAEIGRSQYISSALSGPGDNMGAVEYEFNFSCDFHNGYFSGQCTFRALSDARETHKPR